MLRSKRIEKSSRELDKKPRRPHKAKRRGRNREEAKTHQAILRYTGSSGEIINPS
jgi:hypothetical protein